jgi:coenzyme F420-0:L-glutamate ligase/coenzyme F420-1:gamma-L-glutamate ligase
MPLTITPIPGLPRIRRGDDLAPLVAAACRTNGAPLADGDIVVVCQKIISKSEGRFVRLADVNPSPLARRIAAQGGDKDPRAVEVVLSETERIVRMGNGRLIVETGPGWVCANAGVDESNCDEPDTVILLPEDPDTSARQLQGRLRELAGAEVAVIVSDTWGRPFREGLTDVALGVAGMHALLDLRGRTDLNGRVLHHTVLAQADALAAAAGLVMGKGDGVPVVLVRGYGFAPAAGTGRDLIRARELDLFR